MPEDRIDANTAPNESGSQRLADRADLAKGLQSFIIKNPAIIAGADIFTIDFLSPNERAGMLAAVLTGVITDDRSPPVVREFVIVLPPSRDLERAQVEAWNEMRSAFQLLAGRALTADEQSWFKARFRVIATPDRRSQSVLELIEAQSERCAVIITEAASYRNNMVAPYVAPGATMPLLPQDVWVPQLHHLADAAVALARKRVLYVALDANELSPNRQELSDLLLSVDGCGVMGSSRDEDISEILGGRVDRWDAWIREGRLGQALRDIETLPSSLSSQKAFLRVQMMHRAGHRLEALRAIREEMAPRRKLDALTRVKLARIAQDANASRLAGDVLGPAVDELDSLEEFESALATAHDASLWELEQRIADRLGILFPDSLGLRQRRRRIMLEARDYAGVAALLASDPNGEGSASFYARLAEHLSVPSTPDYYALISSAAGDADLAEAFRMACVSDALERQLIFHAYALAMPIPTSNAQSARGERLLLRVIEKLFLLAGKDGNLPTQIDRVQAGLIALVERLAKDPTNLSLRIGLVSLLQPSVGGRTGLALMISVVLRLASRPVEAEKRNSPGHANLDWLSKHRSFVESVSGWLKGEEPVVIGQSILPKELLTELPDEAVSACADYLSHAPLGSDEDARGLQFWLAFSASIAPYSSDPDYDLRLMRLVAGRLATSGHPQLARDLAEQALMNSISSARRRRLGWFAMADVYHRCHNLTEGLLFLACTLAADDKGDEEQIWQEISGLARFLRDCGFHDEARSVVGKARVLLDRMGLTGPFRHRLDTLELQIRHMAMYAHGSNKGDLEELLADAVRNGADVVAQNDVAAPAAAMLGQLLRFARERGANIPPNAEAILAELSRRSEGAVGTFVGTISTDTPSAEDLLALLKMTGNARYSDDVGYDMRNVAIIAGRALANDEFITGASDTSFALELLADRGIAIPGWDEASEPPPALRRIDESSEIACSISREGISVVQVGFDGVGRLVRVSAVGGILQNPVREPDEVFNEERFKRWAVEYPYAYGIDESTPNVFYTTTADLRLSALPNGPVVIAADASLQPFPPNIFYAGSEFAGRTNPMAAVPSLSWLHAARLKGPIGDGRLCAWVSTATGGSRNQTLSMVAQRLEPTFAQYGFIVDNGPTLPAVFAGATMAIITAHGSIHPEARYFQVVSDEGTLRVTAADLAAALRNVEIVILFVCSGGRADKHPSANTTLGLARQILDRGCQAVIASPWPLDARVPSHWLPTFLEQWWQGHILVEANFLANKIVDRSFARDPATGLAMTLFGNPLLRRP